MIINVQKERLTDGSEVFNVLLCQPPSEGGNDGRGDDDAVVTINCLTRSLAYALAARLCIEIEQASNECPGIVESEKQP